MFSWRGLLCLYAIVPLTSAIFESLSNKTFVFCLAGEVCVGETCEGTFDAMVSVNYKNKPNTSGCFPAFPLDTVVAVGDQVPTINSTEIKKALDQKPGTVENERLHATNLYFTIPIFIRTENDLNASVDIPLLDHHKGKGFTDMNLSSDVFLYPMNYSIPDSETRLYANTYDTRRCNEEVCVPEVCTFLDMNYFGEPLIRTHPRLSTTVLNETLKMFDCNATTDREAGCILRELIVVNQSEIPQNDNSPPASQEEEYFLRVVRAMSYCGPIFGTSVTTNHKKSPAYEALYEKNFPTKRPVSAVYNRFRHSGALVPDQAGRFNPDHYYEDEAEGRYGDGMLKVHAPACNTRVLPRYMFANICSMGYQHTAVTENCIGTKDKPKAKVTTTKSFGDETQSSNKGNYGSTDETKSQFTNVLFTLNDPLIMIGPWVGYASHGQQGTGNPPIKEYYEYGYFFPFVARQYRRDQGTNNYDYFADLDVLTMTPQYYSDLKRMSTTCEKETPCTGSHTSCATSTYATKPSWKSLIKWGYPLDCFHHRFTKLERGHRWHLVHGDDHLAERIRLRKAHEFYETRESLANSLVINQFWSTTSVSLGGFLNDRYAFGKVNATSVYEFPFKIQENMDKFVANETFNDCLIDESDKDNQGENRISCQNDPSTGKPCHVESCLYQLDYDRASDAKRQVITTAGNSPQPQDTFTALKSPLQTKDPDDDGITYDNCPSTQKTYKDMGLGHLLGKNFATFMTAMYSTSMMVDQNGKVFDYYHPMFRPVVFRNKTNTSLNPKVDDGCYLDHNKNTSSYQDIDVGSNYQGIKGYCYCHVPNGAGANPDYTAISNQATHFAASAVSIIRAFHMLVKLYDEDCKKFPATCNTQSPPSLCEGTVGNSLCVIPTVVRRYVCNFQTPYIVNLVLSERDVTVDSHSGKMSDPDVHVASDSLCDTQVCDVVQEGGAKHGHYKCAAQHSSELRDHVADNSGLQLDARYANQGWGGEPDDFFKNFVPEWYRTDTVFERDNRDKASSRYCYKENRRCDKNNNWMLMQSPKDASSADVDYYKAVEFNVKEVAVYNPSDMDAGFSNEKSTRESITCDCDNQPIVLECSGTVPDKIATDYSTLNANNPAFSNLDLSACSYSFKYSAKGPNIGLYLPSTSKNVVIIERNLANFTVDVGAQARHDEMNRLLLDPLAPLGDVGRSKLIYKDEHLFDTPEHTSLFKTTFTYSCMRYPYGRLHRAHMSYDAQKELYGDPENQNTTIEHESLVGYCEFVNTASGIPQFRHCPNTRHTPEERRKFCTESHTQFMATHMLYGYKVTSMDRSSACSAKYKVCLIIPGSPDNAGDIKSYTNDKVAGLGYTLMVTPFNASFLSRYLLQPKALPTVPLRNHPFVMPDYNAATHLKPVDDNMMFETFGYDSGVEDMLLLAASVEMFLDNSTNPPPTHDRSEIEKAVAHVVTSFVNILTNYTDRTNRTNCTKSDNFIIPELGAVTLKECVAQSEILLPLDEILIAVEHDDMKIVSAYQPVDQHVFPVKFKGVPDRAPTCERFISGGSQFQLHAEFDQSDCLDLGFDKFHMVPVKLVGVKLDKAEMYIDSKTTPLPMTVAVLGSDAELFNVPTELKLKRFKASIVSNASSDFDVAFARVTPDGVGAEVLVQCLEPITYAESHCRILMLGVKDYALPVHFYSALPGPPGWDPRNDTSLGVCTYGPPEKILDADLCRITDISDYTGVFALGYEQVALRRSEKHHHSALNVVSIMLCILLAGLVCINIALWFDDSSKVRHAAGLQPHRVSYADLSHIDGVTCKGTKVSVNGTEYTIPKLENAIKTDPSAFSHELKTVFA